MRTQFITMVLAVCAAHAAVCQTLSVDRWTQGQLMEKARQLETETRGQDGSASTKLNEYPKHFTMIALRHKDGGAEIHEHFADIFLVVRGKATLLTGGTVTDARTVSTGEIRGTSVENGKRMILKQGDIVHIPATLPHQLLVPNDGTFIYFVIKVMV